MCIQEEAAPIPEVQYLYLKELVSGGSVNHEKKELLNIPLRWVQFREVAHKQKYLNLRAATQSTGKC